MWRVLKLVPVSRCVPWNVGSWGWEHITGRLFNGRQKYAGCVGSHPAWKSIGSWQVSDLAVCPFNKVELEISPAGTCHLKGRSPCGSCNCCNVSAFVDSRICIDSMLIQKIESLEVVRSSGYRSATASSTGSGTKFLVLLVAEAICSKRVPCRPRRSFPRVLVGWC